MIEGVTFFPTVYRILTPFSIDSIYFCYLASCTLSETQQDPYQFSCGDGLRETVIPRPSPAKRRGPEEPPVNQAHHPYRHVGDVTDPSEEPMPRPVLPTLFIVQTTSPAI